MINFDSFNVDLNILKITWFHKIVCFIVAHLQYQYLSAYSPFT